MLHAIIDIGSNTIRMAVYQIEGDAFTMLMKRKHTAGLAGCLADGRLTREGVDLTIKILGGFVDLIDALGISRVHAFATAALRTATNRAAVLAEIERRTGVRIRVLSGAEEAAYAFRGAAASIPYADGIMADIGGGSTEIVSFAGGTMQERWSLPLGSLALR
ncbi:MAG: phosphatase, partial [Selenomonas sp.]|nr:phosphatase [Selenomonas sp.]